MKYRVTRITNTVTDCIVDCANEAEAQQTAIDNNAWCLPCIDYDYIVEAEDDDQ